MKYLTKVLFYSLHTTNFRGQQRNEHIVTLKLGLNLSCHLAGESFLHDNSTVNKNNGPEMAIATEQFKGGGCVHTVILIWF